MGRKHHWLTLALMLLVWAATPHLSLAQTRVVINGYDEDSPPFSYVDDSDSPVGFDIEVLNRIAELEGLQMSHESVAFDEMIPTLQGEYAADGETIDIIDSGFSITPEREAQVSFTVPYLQIRKVLVIPSESNLNVEQILAGGQTIAARDGSTEADFIDAQNLPLYLYGGLDEALDDLTDGVVSAVAMDEITATRYVQSDGVKIAGALPMPPQEIGFAVRKDDTDLLNALNDGLNQLMGSPEWDSLKQKYGLSS